ncbi:hypothetical protein ODV97_06795 [Enterococcus gallinarum]|nr:hypothetical protein [Enterococcus gallinarum]
MSVVLVSEVESELFPQAATPKANNDKQVNKIVFSFFVPLSYLFLEGMFLMGLFE